MRKTGIVQKNSLWGLQDFVSSSEKDKVARVLFAKWINRLVCKERWSVLSNECILRLNAPFEDEASLFAIPTRTIDERFDI